MYELFPLVGTGCHQSGGSREDARQGTDQMPQEDAVRTPSQ